MHTPEQHSNDHADPVEIQISPDGTRVDVSPVSEEYLRLARHPAYKGSTLVQNAAAASRLIVTGSSALSNLMTSGADNFTKSTKPVNKPMTFKPATHDRVRQIHGFTQGAAGLSAKTVGQATKIAQNLGAGLSGNKKSKKTDKSGQSIPEEYKPGLLNKSMIAFSTIADGIAYSGKQLLEQGGTAASTVVGHRYGEEAGGIAAELAGGVKNVGLVYIDVTGVSRRAVIKSVAKGMVVGRVDGGGEIVVGGGDGGVVPESDMRKAGIRNDNMGAGQPGGPPHSGAGGHVGFGNATPGGTSGVGEPSGGQGVGQSGYPMDKKYR